MAGRLLAGFWRCMLSVPPFLWEKQVEKGRRKIQSGIRFMTPEHRTVHHYLVRELPKVGEPISAECAAERLLMPLERVQAIFEDLENHMTFVCRDDSGSVVWAYPVTVARTPHSLTFSTGERVHAA